jgi:esterase/lipase superfamily enzyme
MKAIALKGRGDSGKSTTLAQLYFRLLDNEAFSLLHTTYTKPKWDFRAVFEIWDLKIGITTKGDTYDIVTDDLKWFQKEGIDICICACRSKDMTDKGTNSAVREYTDSPPNYILKTVAHKEEDFEKANKKDSERLFTALDRLICKLLTEPDEEKEFSAMPVPDNMELEMDDAVYEIDEGADMMFDMDGTSESGGHIKKWIFPKSSPKKDPGGEVTLFYGTNRSVTGKNVPNDFFGSKLDKLKYGTCTVSIPSGHRQGEIERPKKILWFEKKENKEKHIVLSTIKEYENVEFHNLLKASLAKCEGKSALIFIHGYNNTFVEAAWRCGQIAYDIPFNGITGFFSWPSDGKTLSYLSDVEKADASIPKLEKFIEDIVKETGVEHLHLIAHSMGNRILTRVLQNLSIKAEFANHIKTINQVVLAAPDIDKNVFNDTILPSIQGVGMRRTLYASDKDKALKLSKRLRRGMIRIGEAGGNIYIASGLDTIDASNVMSEGNHHSYIFETKELLTDLYLLLTQGLDPMSRRLREQKREALSYWLFRE